jgi:16S rRNA (cytosine1402-N4)-methyltransferase
MSRISHICFLRNLLLRKSPPMIFLNVMFFVGVTSSSRARSRMMVRSETVSSSVCRVSFSVLSSFISVSSHHFDDAERGFSFRFDAPLDMRMNKRAGKTAADILNTYDEQQLADVLYIYGELKNSRRIAAAVAKARSQAELKTTNDLLKAVEPLFRREREKKDMAKMFQALRIEVNHEMDALKEMLHAATELLAEGGRLSVITYHSLEDRIVKNVMKAGNPEGKMVQDFFGRVETPFKLVNNKVILPSDDEQQRNPRSRSAKLRIAEKK